MESKLPLSKEHGSECSQRHDPVFRIKQLDVEDHKEKYGFLGLYYEFFLKVQQEDLSGIMNFCIEGEEEKIPEIEAVLIGFMHQGAEVNIVYADDRVIGFVLYHRIFPSVVAIRHFYVEEEYRGQKVGMMLIEALMAKRILFQTRKEMAPQEMLGRSKSYSKIDENDKIITWEMTWH